MSLSKYLLYPWGFAFVRHKVDIRRALIHRVFAVLLYLHLLFYFSRFSKLSTIKEETYFLPIFSFVTITCYFVFLGTLSDEDSKRKNVFASFSISSGVWFGSFSLESVLRLITKINDGWWKDPIVLGGFVIFAACFFVCLHTIFTIPPKKPNGDPYEPA